MSNNEENRALVADLMAKAEQVKLGGELKAGVYIDHTTVFGTELKGSVVFKRPTMLDYVKIGAIKSEYLRSSGVVNANLVDNSVKFIAQVMATLQVVIVKSPEWLIKLDSVQEPDILYHVYEKYEEWENSFRKVLEKPVPEHSETPE